MANKKKKNRCGEQQNKIKNKPYYTMLYYDVRCTMHKREEYYDVYDL